MKIIGIDPGSRITGFGVVESQRNTARLLDSGVVKADPKVEFHLRLKVLYDGMMEVIADSRPDVVAIESVFHYRNVMSMLKLGQARGVLMLAAANFNLPLVEYSPKEVKAAVTGNGNASKEQVQQAVMADLGLAQPSRFDVTDALAVAICHCHRIRF